MTRDISAYKKLAEKSLEALRLEHETPRGLFAPISYMLEGGGKRLRPVLLLVSCDAVGGDASRCQSQAAGIEMFHNFTLLHDDVMDRSPLRHGKPTVHKKWDVATAIL
ncbi:MAG: polyprenyl synthetase family protein, partial [Muribaculaceae bacterium]|nr:polyprenyl synthetase family protein [Muribaculaceae bacterium]